MAGWNAYQDELKKVHSIKDVRSEADSFIFSIDLDADVHDKNDDQISEIGDLLFDRGRDFPLDNQSPWPNLSFSEYREQMDKVTEKMYKIVITSGNGEKIDLECADVTYDYSAFFEFSKDPFDSSANCKRPGLASIRTGIIPLEGYFLALTTMEEGEEAIFWIDSDLLYGKLGCPPKIPQRADALVRIKVIDTKIVNDTGAYQTESKVVTFERLIRKVSKDYKTAMENFQVDNIHRCIEIYLKNIEKLESFSVSCEEHDEVRKKLLIKIYRGICICYNKIEKPKKTCIMMRELEKLTSISLNPKDLLLKGRANMMLGDYNYARSNFSRAQILAPDDRRVILALKSLDEKIEAKCLREKEKEERLEKFKNEGVRDVAEPQFGVADKY